MHRRLLRSLPSDRWMIDAACRYEDPQIFFLDDNDTGGHPTGTYAEARRICERCPVVVDCLEFGLYETHGIWGGLSPRERKTLREQRARVA